MQDITTLEEEATSIMVDVSTRLTKAKKPVDGDTLTIIQNRMRRAAQAIKAMKIEIRDLPKEKQANLNISVGKLEARFNQLNSDIIFSSKDSKGNSNTHVTQ
jgi:hypothetical protein